MKERVREEGAERARRWRPQRDLLNKGTRPPVLMYVLESRTWGGAEAYVRYVIEGLDREAWDVHLVCPRMETLAPLLRWAQREGLRVHALPGERPRHLPALVAFFRMHRPDVVHFNLHHPFACRYAILAATLAGVPVRVATNHLPTIPPNVYTWKGRLALQLAYQCLHAMLVDSATNQRRALAHYPIASGKIRIVPHGIRVENFPIEGTRASVAEEFGLEARAPIVGTVGRLSIQKATEDFIEAAALLRQRFPDAQFLIVGEGERRLELERLVETRGLKACLRFAGYREDVPRLLAAMDVFVLSSIYEGMPFAILEAMAAARPVVATRVDGVPEVVAEGETGLLVPPRAPERLAEAIGFLLAHPDRAREMGRRGRERVRTEFSWERMVKTIEQLYRTLMARKSRRGAVNLRHR
ncbi:MAG: glycosyltransferase [Blastocatellia bacterium]|nr:glycosyltransferase [Blastocatellia bacterium]MDW8167517.1 glycosyltransferase [Acidobacteriota bacterium]